MLDFLPLFNNSREAVKILTNVSNGKPISVSQEFVREFSLSINTAVQSVKRHNKTLKESKLFLEQNMNTLIELETEVKTFKRKLFNFILLGAAAGIFAGSIVFFVSKWLE